ncbi:MAG: sigma 54-interacting transcriptional regulator [Planctomycetota bacterium]|nr:sigma 54-interacting transcriptional regulator [Planctomycetota bacterium]
MRNGPSNERQEVILDSISDGVFTVDRNWRVTSFNRAAEQITGVPREEAIGRRCSDVFRASICENECALRRTLKTGRPLVNRAVYIIRADGQRVPISISTAILRDRKGNVIGGAETFRDLSEVEQLRKELEGRYSFADIVGRSAAMQKLFGLLPTVAESDSTVLLEGASGTGKELVARAIHELSTRRAGPFVAVNCGALPDTLLESELFGYKAGAFTDARRDKPGRFALAEGGTILLDEIADVSTAMQTRLLRVLQDHVYEPLGAVESQRADVRVIAASNRDLDDLVKEGAFRRDLYYRINVVRLKLPELCDRLEDIPPLVDHFVGKFNRLQGKDVVGVSDEAMSCLMRYDYPGNVRELENIIERAFAVCRCGLIDVKHLPAEVAPDEEQPLEDGPPAPLRAMEGRMLLEAVRRHRGNRTAAARELAMHPSTLYRKARALGIDLPREDGRHRRSS